MTRELGLEVDGKPLPGWVMVCNYCWTTRSDVRPTQDALPLEEFRDAGWLIGKIGDICPTCITSIGGVTEVAQRVEPHPVMAPPGGLGLLHSPELWS